MGFRRRTTDQLDELQRQLAALGGALETEQARRVDLEAQLASVTDAPPPALTPPASEPTHGTTPATTPPPPAPGTSLADVQRDLGRLLSRLDALDNRTAATQQQLRLRLDEVVTQMTNQLGELAGELDQGYATLRAELTAQDARLQAIADAERPSPQDLTDALGELRSNQVKIANDLARHEIAIRQDLASLADLLGKAGRHP